MDNEKGTYVQHFKGAHTHSEENCVLTSHSWGKCKFIASEIYALFTL